MSTSKIKEFYKNQTIFLTGGSGFLGKVLIEKLLRECEDLDKIYILMRQKRDKSPEQRLEELLSFACFDNLKNKNKNVFKKLQLIIGDCQQPFLGLSDQDIDTLIKQTTCVIHAAANVKFDQSLKEAASNVRATRDILELAKQMKKLQVFVYVSTAYSNCIYSDIKEDFYPPLMKADKLFSLLNSLDDETIDAITPNLLKDCPNTYIFSKSISEDLVKTASEFLPITVVRPAIVTNSIAEPVPGWIDNFYGAVGIVCGAALGVIRTMHANLDAKANLVPVDYISNCVLASAWKNANCTKPTIYNLAGHKKTLLTWGEFFSGIEPLCWQAASVKFMWYSKFILRNSKLFHQLSCIFFHTLPAYVIDFILFCLRKPTLAVRNSRKLAKALDSISYFCLRSWNFEDNHVIDLWNDMTEDDKKLFCFNMEYINWEQYGRDSVQAGRIYLLKDTPDTLEQAKQKVKVLFVVHYAVIAVWWILVYALVKFIVGFFF